MNTNVARFLKEFAWYRSLSLNLLDQIAEEHLGSKVSERSMTLRSQFVDLGILQLKILELLSCKEFFNRVVQPDESTATKGQIKSYLLECDKIFSESLDAMYDPNTTISWFGRMTFNFDQALTFVLSHEAMHHGEILSNIFANDFEMPEAFKNTWGFEL